MTAPAAVNLAALERDIAVVLARHGLGDHDSLHVAAYEIEQAGHIAGVTVTAHAYTPPPGVPTPKPADGSTLTALAERMEVTL